MTEQVRLTGDRSTNPELNDSIAFSRYTESIDRISHQYSLWEEAQQEFQAYIEHHRVAQLTVESLGHTFSSVEISELQSIPSASASKQILEDGV